MDSDFNLFVTDAGKDRIMKFDSTGTYMATFGTTGSDYGEFDKPLGIAVDWWGNIFVTDHDNHRIQQLSNDGDFKGVMGTYDTTGITASSALGEFNNPSDISIDNVNQLIWVADTGNDRIQKFSTRGQFLATYSNYAYNDTTVDYSAPRVVLEARQPLSDDLYVGEAGQLVKIEFTLEDPSVNWNLMVDALGVYKTSKTSSNLDAAMAYFSEGGKQRYRSIIENMSSPEFNTFYSDLNEPRTSNPDTSFTVLEIGEKTATCRLEIEEGQGQNTTIYNYDIHFVKEDGTWKVKQF